MALVATTYLGLYAALRRTSRIWSIIAAVMRFLGIVVFHRNENSRPQRGDGCGAGNLVRHAAEKYLQKVIAYLGILASVLLLAGDFGTTENSASTIVAVLIGIGYGAFNDVVLPDRPKALRIGAGRFEVNVQSNYKKEMPPNIGPGVP